MSAKQNWNPELYEGRHSFVWQLGQGILELLNPLPGESILDLGCGTGQLTNEIASSGAKVTGLDSSPDMIGQARQNYPKLRFVLGDAAGMQFENEFDAIFSNAALHWMLDPAAVARSMIRALQPGGRLVAEFGGQGNIGQIVESWRAILPTYSNGAPVVARTYFPSISEYAGILEQVRFEVRFAQLFDRLTPLEGERGMENWLRQFGWYNFEPLPPEKRHSALGEVIAYLKPKLYRDGQWFADYRRLRIIAVKKNA
ncbi:MAG TPA: methyltransferase domain-containing protein [Bryobacteraceae bacterium]|jgi:trans-aconitate 2-methyltransferase|nr:methyltransferase domain-containing protein [Bryobacteraceae bacterium]